MPIITQVFTQSFKPKTSTQRTKIIAVKGVTRTLENNQTVECIVLKFKIVSGEFEGFIAESWFKPTHPKLSIANLDIDRLMKTFEAFNVESGRPADLEGCEAEVRLEVRKGKCCEFYSISPLTQVDGLEEDENLDTALA